MTTFRVLVSGVGAGVGAIYYAIAGNYPASVACFMWCYAECELFKLEHRTAESEEGSL